MTTVAQTEVQCDPGSRPELWQGAVEWTAVDDGWQPWRLLPEEEPYAYAPELYARARAGAGVRFVADVTAERLEIELSGASEDHKPVDILVDGELVSRQPVAERTVATLELAAPGRVEVWLPHAGECRVHGLRLIGPSATATPATPRTRWVTYGSSITQASASPGPSQTWPALVARNLDWDLTCLGFGGQCHLDHAVRTTIDQLEADIVSLCLGINIQGGGTFNPRTLPGQLSSFVRGVRRSHPQAPILVISPIISPAREDTPNAAGLSLSQIRELVTRVVTDLVEAGDDKLHLVNGHEIFGADDLAMLPDGLHPDGDGYALMAERLAPKLSAIAPVS